MSIIFTRVDDRLIHGQVVQGWLPGMDIEEVVVVTPNMGGFKMAALMRMALPMIYEMQQGSAADMAEYLKKADKKIFLLIYSLKELEELVNAGVNLKHVNIGGIHYAHGKTEVCDNFFLNKQEREILKTLAESGINFDCRSVPKAEDLNVIKKIQG